MLFFLVLLFKEIKVFNQKSPVHPVSESRGDPLSHTGGMTEILVPNIGLATPVFYTHIQGFLSNIFLVKGPLLLFKLYNEPLPSLL